MNLRGYSASKEAYAAANYAAVLKRFWEMSEELTGIRYEFQ
jgi:hypothetical protein